MSLISDLIIQLQSNTTLFASIAHAQTLEPFQTPATDSPVLYVYPGEETVQEEALDMCGRQRVTIPVELVYIVPHADLEAAREEVKNALFGWHYSAYDYPFSFKTGQTKGLAGIYIWWQESFQINRRI